MPSLAARGIASLRSRTIVSARDRYARSLSPSWLSGFTTWFMDSNYYDEISPMARPPGWKAGHLVADSG